MTYASGTTVPVEKSRAEIERLVTRYKATGFVSGWENGRAAIMFNMNERRVKFVLRLPSPDDFRKDGRGSILSPARRQEKAEQATRERWRALALVIKAKLEAVESGITIFDEEFMAHIVMPDGMTVAEHVMPRISDAYSTGTMQPLLPAPRSA